MNKKIIASIVLSVVVIATGSVQAFQAHEQQEIARKTKNINQTGKKRTNKRKPTSSNSPVRRKGNGCNNNR